MGGGPFFISWKIWAGGKKQQAVHSPLPRGFTSADTAPYRPQPPARLGRRRGRIRLACMWGLTRSTVSKKYSVLPSEHSAENIGRRWEGTGPGRAVEGAEEARAIGGLHYVPQERYSGVLAGLLD